MDTEILHAKICQLKTHLLILHKIELVKSSLHFLKMEKEIFWAV